MSPWGTPLDPCKPRARPFLFIRFSRWALSRGLCSAGHSESQILQSLLFLSIFSALGDDSFLESTSHFMRCPLPKLTIVLLSLRLFDVETAHSCRFHVQIILRTKALSDKTADFFILKLIMKVASALCFIFIKV